MQNADMSREALSPPKPGEGWSHRVEILHDCVIVPPSTRAFSQPGGILRSNGSYCHQGALWRKSRPLTTRPDAPNGALREMHGTWLWGGVLWDHFGHFLVESTGRLWALSALPEDVKGIVVMRKKPKPTGRLEEYQRDFFRLGGVTKVRVLDAPARVEKLFVPGQAFGLGQIASGTPHMRHWFHQDFARDVAPDGPEKLYISRSGLGPGRAKLLCEARLDSYLQAQGYSIFHPQLHDMRTQIARYKAAKQVIACEGSAIHLFAMVARPHQRLAIMVRRLSEATHYIQQHVTGFADVEPLLINAINAAWLPEGEERKRLQISSLDFAQAQRALAMGGFVSMTPAWENPGQEEQEAALAASDSRPMVPVLD